jgi:ABC-type Fe3+/spermidine/putrescine transport system ATPase subunit
VTIGNINLETKDSHGFRDGQKIKLVFRPEDVFLRRPENLTQNYQKLAEGTIDEVSFVGAFERVAVRLDLAGEQTIMVMRPKTETAAFPLRAGQQVTAGLVRFRILAANSPA